MSDWYAINSDAPTHFSTGCDMNMPGGPYQTTEKTGKDGSYWSKLPIWLENGDVTQERIDDAAVRILATMYKFNQVPKRKMDENDVYPNYVNLDTDTLSSENKELNRKAGRDSIVLLKNMDNYLPITKNQYLNRTYSKMVVIGNNAIESDCLKIDMSRCVADDKRKYFTGYMGLGWGSGTTIFNYQVPPLTALTAKANELNIPITSSTNINRAADVTYDGVDYITFEEDIEGGKKACVNSADTLTFLIIGSDTGEEGQVVEGNRGDRRFLEPWHKGTELVNGVLEQCPDATYILIVFGASTTIINDWVNNDKIKAIVYGGQLGAEGGNALVDILFGDYSPSGHLTFTWGSSVNEYPIVEHKTSTSNIPFITTDYDYDEGIYIGYRYFMKNGITPLYAFGFGLSYSSFTFNNDLNLKMEEKGLTVKFSVTNSGKYQAAVVPMVFLKFPINDYPAKVFKGFDKKLLNVGQTENFEILIEPHDLSYYNVSSHSFVRPTSGNFVVYVGENVSDEKLTAEVSASY